MKTVEAKSAILDFILKAIRNIINRIPSCLDGFEVTESEATIDQGIYKATRIFVSGGDLKDPDGNPINLKIDLAALDVDSNETISKCLEGISRIEVQHKIDPSNSYQAEAYKILLGMEPADIKDIKDVKSSRATSSGLLYPVHPDAKELSTQWQELLNSLQYALRCEAKGYRPGNANNANLAKIKELVSSYLVLCGAESTENMSNARGVQLVYLVMPIVQLIQQRLSNYLDDTIKSVYGESEDANDTQLDDTQLDNNEGADDSSEPSTTPDVDNAQSGATSTPQPSNASKKISIKLQKITATSDINVLGIQTDYNPGEALDVVDDILSNPDFTDLITETPQTYEVCVDDEGYDVNPCTDLIVEPNENLTQLFIQAIQFSRNLHMIHWLAIGNDMEKLHIKAEELYGELDEEIDLLAELIVEKTGTIIDINKIETWDTVGTQNRTFQQGIECIKQYAQSFIDYIDITYPNQPSDVQSILDDWLRYWNKQINYFITREQEN